MILCSTFSAPPCSPRKALIPAHLRTCYFALYKYSTNTRIIVIMLLLQALTIRKDDPYALVARAHTYAKMGIVKESLDDVNNVLKEDPNNHQVCCCSSRPTSNLQSSSSSSLCSSLACPMMQCSRVDDTSPEHAVTGLSPGWVDPDVYWLYRSTSASIPPQRGGTWASTRFPPMTGRSKRRR